jgi:CRP-like cAMP-binding protein
MYMFGVEKAHRRAGGTEMDKRMPVPGPPQHGKATGRWPSSSLLSSLDQASRERLLEAGTTTQYRAGQILVREGETSSFVIALLDGVVKATGVTSEGKQALLAIRVGGDIVGEFAALDDRPRSATLTACGVVVGCVIRQADFLAILKRDPPLAQAVNRSILAKMRSADERRIDFAGYEAPIRLARVLRELATRYGDLSDDQVTISWQLTQPELASLAAVAEPTAQKVLRKLREQGIISTGYRSLTVLNLSELGRIAGI